MINVILRGKVSQILNDMILAGHANMKSEAIRLAILNFGEHVTEEAMVSAKLDRVNKEIKEGKRKLLNLRDALGAYVEYTK